MKNLNAMNVKDSDIWEMNVQTSSKTKKMTRIKKKRKKKILKVTLESADENNSKEFLKEFCFITNDEEEEIDKELQATFKDMYYNFINIDKINKDLKIMV